MEITIGEEIESLENLPISNFLALSICQKAKNVEKTEKNVKDSIFQIFEAYFLPNTMAVVTVTLNADSVKNLGSIS